MGLQLHTLVGWSCHALWQVVQRSTRAGVLASDILSPLTTITLSPSVLASKCNYCFWTRWRQLSLALALLD
jgi:hypothetical protein